MTFSIFKKSIDLYGLWQGRLPKPVKNRAMVAWYNLIARLDRKNDLLFMNHGYAPEPGAEERLFIPPDLETFRYPIQLYDLLARQLNWRDKDALEVSSGLGGGALWIWQRYAPQSLTGLDIAARAVRDCRRRYGQLGLAFEAGDAQAMPFADASFDVVLNVESSLNYPAMANFLGEVQRVLRPDGHFLFADYRPQAKVARLQAQLAGLSFETLMLTDITDGILRGLAHEEARKRDLINRLAPRLLKRAIADFAGLGPGRSGEYHWFVSRRKAYIAAVLRKPL